MTAAFGCDLNRPTQHYAFARAYAAAKLGKVEEARVHLAEISPGGEGANREIIVSAQEIDILKLQVESVIAISDGNSGLAIKLARKAADIQATMPFRYGPPRISKPTSELLADLLLELGRYEEASEIYADQLSRSQLRINSLVGLARASSKSGDEATVRETYDSLSKIWHSADQNLPIQIKVAEFERQ